MDQKMKNEILEALDFPKLEKVLLNLAECRKSYQGEISQDEIEGLLENTMEEVQDLLSIYNIDWQE